jgi:predicted XRE-type DNA-binding protein
MKGFGPGVMEIALPYRGNAFRVVLCSTNWHGAVGRACVPEEIDPRYQDPEARDRSDRGTGETVKGNAAMKKETLTVIRGSGNVYRDLGQGDADVKQFKALLAAEIIKTLDRDGLTVRAAHARTGIAAADFSRIRNADLARFTLDRLVGIINRLGSRVELKVKVKPAKNMRLTELAGTLHKKGRKPVPVDQLSR